MIAIVWGVLAAWFCGGIYGAGRVLARDDMPLTDLPGGERDHFLSSTRSPATTRPVVSLPGPDREVGQRFSNRAGEPGPAGQLPEWVQSLLQGDIEAAVARDVAHCQRMATA